jgi:hypothetical protein
MARKKDPKVELSRLIKKSIWQAKRARLFSFFCPVCEAPHQMALPSEPSSRRVILRLLALTAFFTLVGWSVFEIRGLVSIVLFAAVYEFYYRLKLRTLLRCGKCGFDPYLYVVDEKQAKQDFETNWRTQFRNLGIPYPGDPVPVEPQDSLNPSREVAQSPVD